MITADAVGVSVALRDHAVVGRDTSARGEIRAVWNDRVVRRLVGIAFLGFGLFVALTTWLQALLEPAGVPDTTAGWMLAAMVVAGVIGSAVLPPAVARRDAAFAFLRIASLVAAAGCVVLAAAPGAAWVAVVPLGFVLLSSLPVILEVTERASLDSSAALNERIATLRRLGFRLAVDDIGAGYSGLTSFTQLMPEVVKIDMSLVRDVDKHQMKQRLIRSVTQLCRDQGTQVIGEGVETEAEAQVLVDLGLTPSVPPAGAPNILEGVESIPVDLETLLSKGDEWSEKYDHLLENGEPLDG